MIRKLGIGNFRVFKEYTEFNLSPITILTGTNSSGKSSLIRFIELLDMSINKLNIDKFDVTTIHEFIGKGMDRDFVNTVFGNMGNLYNKKFNNENKEIKFGVQQEFLLIEFTMINLHPKQICFYACLNEEKYNFLEIECDDINYSKYKLDLNNLFFFLGEIYDIKISNFFKKYLKEEKKEEFERDLEERYKKNQDCETLDQKYIFFLIELFDLLKEAEFNMHSIHFNFFEQIHTDSIFDILKYGHTPNNVIELQEVIEEYFNKFTVNDIVTSVFETMDSIKYMRPLLIFDYHISNMEDSYPFRIWNESTVFINGKSKFNYNRETNMMNNDALSKALKKIDSFHKSAKEVFIKIADYYIEKLLGEGNNIEIRKPNDSLYTQVFINNSITNESQNIADMGLGISQIITILLSLNFQENDLLNDGIRRYFERLIIIEEPETNLHPALQSKLAEILVDISKNFNIQFIIETHSEYLIRKMQALIVQKELKAEDVNCYYFYHPEKVPEGDNQIYEITFSEDGAMSRNFGKGFFDEASNLNIALYNKTKIDLN